jgi:hypothetical protein
VHCGDSCFDFYDGGIKMNERIKELLNRSGGEFYEGFLGSPNTIKFTEEELKTFAELIVRECAEFARQHNLEKADRSHMIHKAIKQHFGVEEK